MKTYRAVGRRLLRGALLTGVCSCSLSLLASTAAAAPPVIEAESVSNVTGTGATLEATIDPGNVDSGAYYQFQLASDPGEFWPEVTCPEENPEPPDIPCLGPYGTVGGPPPAASITRRPGDLPTVGVFGPEGVPVSLDLEAAGVVLEPGMTYHYRVIAVERAPTVDTIVWETPPTYGANQTFVTEGGEGPGEPPLVSDPLPPVQSVLPPVYPSLPVAPSPRLKCPRSSKAGARQRVQGNHKAGHSNRRCRRHRRGAVARSSVAS
jgi:hypothetical protein